MIQRWGGTGGEAIKKNKKRENKKRGDSRFTDVIFSHTGQFLPLLPGQEKRHTVKVPV